VGELLVNLKILLEIQDEEENEKLTLFLKKASKAVAKRRYPFGYSEEQMEYLLELFDDTILDIAVFLYSKQGAEGQTSHSENGIGRSYEGAGIPDSYLDDIVPVCRIH